MPDTVIEKSFAEFEVAAGATFRPPGVAEAQRRIRVRRRRRGLLAGLLALLLAGPAGTYAAAHRGDPPVPRPIPTVSPTPGGKVIERKIALPGVPGGLTGLQFVDSRTGWALFDTCDSNDPMARGCRRTVARTTDGGTTWTVVALPEAPDGAAYLLPRDGRTLTVVAGRRYLVTVDGGATFSSSPLDSPSAATRRAMATPNGFVVACPSFLGPGDGARGKSCDRQQVLRVDDDPLPQQPPVTLRPGGEHALMEGGDGRLWLTVTEGDRLTVVTSDDRGATWRKLPAVVGARSLTVSPDGMDAWLVRTDAPNGTWRLAGDRWQPGPGVPDETYEVAAAGDGILVVSSRYGGLGFVADGRYVDVPELRDALRSNPDDQPAVAMLPDGTVQIRYGGTQFLGIGRGVERTWIRLS
ncbi:hypothetical protein ABZV78_11050 [Micromonospora sp. NPDC004540]|uniref:WD40/YVTN/BNR-like repeat-containing protein n=1 Tax=Micromonospora sp. NPDC004540 TaxID=3154457 RepID=UPI0033BE6D9E